MTEAINSLNKEYQIVNGQLLIRGYVLYEQYRVVVARIVLVTINARRSIFIPYTMIVSVIWVCLRK